MTIKELMVRSHQIAIDHGFYGRTETIDTTPARIALMHSELSEALEEFRKGRMDLWWETDSEGVAKPEGFGIELADLVIRVADTAEELGIDLETLIEIKEAYNRNRPFMHGRAL